MMMMMMMMMMQFRGRLFNSTIERQKDNTGYIVLFYSVFSYVQICVYSLCNYFSGFRTCISFVNFEINLFLE